MTRTLTLKRLGSFNCANNNERYQNQIIIKMLPFRICGILLRIPPSKLTRFQFMTTVYQTSKQKMGDHGFGRIGSFFVWPWNNTNEVIGEFQPKLYLLNWLFEWELFQNSPHGHLYIKAAGSCNSNIMCANPFEMAEHVSIAPLKFKFLRRIIVRSPLTSNVCKHFWQSLHIF